MIIITNPHFRQFNSIEKRLPPAGENHQFILILEQGKSNVLYKKDENKNFSGKWDPPRNSQFKTCKSLKKWLVLNTANVRPNEWNLFLDVSYRILFVCTAK